MDIFYVSVSSFSYVFMMLGKGERASECKEDLQNKGYRKRDKRKQFTGKKFSFILWRVGPKEGKCRRINLNLPSWTALGPYFIFCLVCNVGTSQDQPIQPCIYTHR